LNLVGVRQKCRKAFLGAKRPQRERQEGASQSPGGPHTHISWLLWGFLYLHQAAILRNFEPGGGSTKMQESIFGREVPAGRVPGRRESIPLEIVVLAQRPSVKILINIYRSEIIRFLIVGGAGLLTNICVLYGLRHEIGLMPAVIISYFVAFSVTWLLNRILTFRSKNSRRTQEWLKYTLIYSATGALQLLSVTWMVHKFLLLQKHPVGAVLIAAGFVAAINFMVSKFYIFKHSSLSLE
jgi:putative flippase GtrA